MAKGRLVTLALTIFALVLAQVSPSFAGSDVKAPGDGFDPARVETIGVTVKQIVTIKPSSSAGYIGPGIQLVVQHGDETLKVPLGPKWYYDRQPVKLAVGDQVSLTGMKPDPQEPVFLVSQITKDNVAATFRDRDGNPYCTRMKVIKVVD